MPDLVALQEKYRNSGLVIAGADVSWSGDTAAALKSFLSTFTPTINYQMVMSNSDLENNYGEVGEIPATFIIDRENYIRKKFSGAQSGATLEHAITPLLFNTMRLTTQSGGPQVTLRWPTNVFPFLLQSSTNIASGWNNWSGTVSVVNGTNTVSVDMTGTPRFFRLQTAN
jgi:hypothetical protein